MARLLRCLDCATVEVLPDLLGPRGSPDPLLDRLVQAHEGPLDNAKGVYRIRMGLGRVREIQPEEGHLGDLHTVPDDDWNNANTEKRDAIRHQILTQMWGSNTGYPEEFYAIKDTYREDAGRCFQRHKRPGDANGPYACGDYQDDSKRLTDRAWRERAQPGEVREHIYLCSFCPYESVVMTRKRMDRGDYNE